MLAGCDNEARDAQRTILETHVPEIKRYLASDLERGVAGVQRAAERLERGFVVEDRERQTREMRLALRLLRQPPRGIDELMISPISFIAAVDSQGIVICRDNEPDHMTGFAAGEEFALVRRALTEGQSGYALDAFPSLVADHAPSHTVLYAAPVRHEERVVGAVLTGAPLWRTAQRLTRQLHSDYAADMQRNPPLVLWVYLYRGEELFHRGTPADLDEAVPDGEARRAGLAEHPDGFSGQIMQFGRWYGYGVAPLPELGPEVGVIVFRSDPG